MSWRALFCPRRDLATPDIVSKKMAQLIFLLGPGDYEFEYALQDQIAEADRIVQKFDNIVDS